MKPAASIPRMSQLALHIIKDVLDAYIEKDAEGGARRLAARRRSRRDV